METDLGLTVCPGQRWGLWVFDDAMYERVTVDELAEDGRTAYCTTEDGNRCVVGVRRLTERGDYLGTVGAGQDDATVRGQSVTPTRDNADL